MSKQQNAISAMVCSKLKAIILLCSRTNAAKIRYNHNSVCLPEISTSQQILCRGIARHVHAKQSISYSPSLVTYTTHTLFVQLVWLCLSAIHDNLLSANRQLIRLVVIWKRAIKLGWMKYDPTI